MKIITGWTGDYFSKHKELCLLSYYSAIKQYPECKYVAYVTNVEGTEEFETVKVLDKEECYGKFYDWIRYEAFCLQDSEFLWVDPDVILFDRLDIGLKGYDFITYSEESSYSCYSLPNFLKFLPELKPYVKEKPVGHNFGVVRSSAEIGTLVGSETLRSMQICKDLYNPTLHHFISQGLSCRVLKRFNKSLISFRERDFQGNLELLQRVAFHLCYPIQSGIDNRYDLRGRQTVSNLYEQFCVGNKISKEMYDKVFNRYITSSKQLV